MKCSLLTLSGFIDDALPAERGAEVDAHLVGCPRCTAGAATLREEKSRIAALARVRVQPESAHDLLEQVGITGALVAEQLHRATPHSTTVPPTRPWLAGGGSAALPWTPQRPPPPSPPSPPAPIAEEQPVPIVSPEVQPDLPFDSTSAVAARAAPAVEEFAEDPGDAADAPVSWSDLDDEPVAPLEPWEAAIPAYTDVVAAPSWDQAPEMRAASASADATESRALEPLPASPDAGDVTAATDLATPLAGVEPGPPPQRLDAPNGARALWERARDLVAVRLALARGDDVGPDSVEAMTGSPAARPLRPPIPGFEAPAVAVHDAPPLPRPGSTAIARHGADDDPMELTGFPGAVSSGPARGTADDDGRWNAFGAAAFRHGVEPLEEAVPTRRPARPVGRHSRAIQRQSVGVGTRVATVVTASMAALRSSGAHAAVAVRGGGRRLAAARNGDRVQSLRSFDRRVLAAIGGVAVIFLLAVLIGRTGSHPATGKANRVPASTAPSVAPHTGTGSSGPAASGPGSASAPLTSMQTFGSGGSGYQVMRVRYGTFNGSQRVVFDVGTASGSASGAPITKIGFSDPNTMLVTFSGTIPAGSLTAVPPGGVIVSITRVPTTDGTTTYRFALSRASTAVAFYLTGPVRFVLDVH